ncbi:MAG: DNA recombination protein RmuC [Nitrospiraceae bacterium]|nr:DNA recombination protein RmuC [Nitrospiraceae bacterium]
MTAVTILLAVLVVALIVYLLTVRTRSGANHAQIESLRGEVREAVAASQENLAGQLAQLAARLDSLTNQVQAQLKTAVEVSARSGEKIDSRLDKATAVIGEVKRSLGALSEANKRIYEVGRDIAGLQEILRTPKLRGGLGETFLGEILQEILPQERFTLQYTFRDGQTVDAVIRLADHLVPIDAKFPLESFSRLRDATTDVDRTKVKRTLIRDVRKHIDAIADKYIRPAEGTLDFALMYIPAENVYYEVITRDPALPADYDLFSYATARRVIPVSPNSFYAYLKTILIGLNGLRLSENVTLILGRLQELTGAFGQLDSDFQLVGKHLRNSLNRFEDANRRLDAFRLRLTALTSVHDEPPSDTIT